MLRVVKRGHVVGALVRNREEPRSPGFLLDAAGHLVVVPCEVISSAIEIQLVIRRVLTFGDVL